MSDRSKAVALELRGHDGKCVGVFIEEIFGSDEEVFRSFIWSDVPFLPLLLQSLIRTCLKGHQQE